MKVLICLSVIFTLSFNVFASTTNVVSCSVDSRIQAPEKGEKELQKQLAILFNSKEYSTAAPGFLTLGWTTEEAPNGEGNIYYQFIKMRDPILIDSAAARAIATTLSCNLKFFLKNIYGAIDPTGITCDDSSNSKGNEVFKTTSDDFMDCGFLMM